MRASSFFCFINQFLTMRKVAVCIVLSVLIMSFQNSDSKVWHYPDFVISYDTKTVPGTSGFEGFSNGVCLIHTTDYFVDVDSVAVKYRNTVNGQLVDTYTNFYSRLGKHQWKKYNSKKEFMYVITEFIDKVGYVQHCKDQSTVIYYRVD